MRILVIGTHGQVARALAERAACHGSTVVAIGRPALDLLHPSGLQDVLREAQGDVIVNAAAYTAVDQAEREPEQAEAINATGAGAVAAAAAALGLPVVQLSTDYVFDGTAADPYREDAPARPLGVYGATKWRGEQAVARACANHAILRTAWVYSPFGSNFVRTMLRLAGGRDEIAVVADQVGSPTSALDLADGILDVCRNLVAHPDEPSYRGVFHIAGTGSASWAELATEIFVEAARYDGPTARVRPIGTAEYPTPAKRPGNSRLDCSRLAAVHGVILPHWRSSLGTCVRRLIEDLHRQELQP